MEIIAHKGKEIIVQIRHLERELKKKIARNCDNYIHVAYMQRMAVPKKDTQVQLSNKRMLQHDPAVYFACS